MLTALLALMVMAAPGGAIHRASPALDVLIAPDARIETIVEGIGWAEGPLWIADGGGYLLFSDVPGNRIHRWSEAEGLSVFLDPSGSPREEPSAYTQRGANGLEDGPGGTILAADHGNRAIASIDLSTRARTFLAREYQGKRLNSPNDLIRAKSGAIYFTDPPYGLDNGDGSPLKEQPHNGVYRLDPDGKVTLIDARLSKPNGIALSPDGQTLYVANSDRAAAHWYAYALDTRGNAVSRRLFADASGEVAPGLPDGLCLDSKGNVFASGPGGLFIFSPTGEKLGLIDTGDLVSNCAFEGPDGRMLYITSNHRVVRVPVLSRGLAAP